MDLRQGDRTPQIMVKNRSGKMLEIHDRTGQPYLRIGPKQVDADVRSKAWKTGQNPFETPSRSPAVNEREWRTIRKEPSYAWFDSRLDTDSIPIPKSVVSAGKPAKLQNWSIAAVLDGKPLDIRGQFVYQPPPQGSVQAVLRSGSVLAPGITLQLAPGVNPILRIQNHSDKTVKVLDANGRAFLSIDATGVRADTSSAAWQAASAIPSHPQSRVGWQKVSDARSYSWLEPRLKYKGAPAKDPAAPQQLGEWTLPLQIEDQRRLVAGVYVWTPAPQRTRVRGGAN